MGGIELPNYQTSQRQPRRERAKLFIRKPLTILLGVILFLQLYLIPSYLYKPSPSALKLSTYHAKRLSVGLAKCAELSAPTVQYPATDASRTNPRHNPKHGQSKPVLLHNATLFDGENILSGTVDIVFEKGVVKSVSPASNEALSTAGMNVFDIKGGWVTPGIVDMHSHELVESWPSLSSTADGNQVDRGRMVPLTPFVRSKDSMSADIAMGIIASGGVTTSLILPGSANIMGGEAYPVKNFMRPNGEEVIEDLMLEHGIDLKERRRYLKMACGENPSRVYGNTRMGNAWLLREQMTKAQALLEKQTSWCLSASFAQENQDEAKISELSASAEEILHSPEALALDSTVAMLRHKMNINVHCYTPNDFEDMLLHSHEFGFRVSAFHHALSAWKVSEMLKEKGENLTIATFAEFGLYKKEAYDSNLYAGKILAEHNVPVAYKSDHSEGELSAKFVMLQAAIGHSFGLPELLALQAVTSIPAKSMEIDHRVGYVRPGYDADIVYWDSHPLTVGATPLQVYIDGRETLDSTKVKESLQKSNHRKTVAQKPQIRVTASSEEKASVCESVQRMDHEIVITGIQESFLDKSFGSSSSDNVGTIILKNGKIACFGSHCVSTSQNSTIISLQNGHVAPGVIAVSGSLGLSEIDTQEETSDGIVSGKTDVTKEENVVHAKYGVHLDGRSFARARFGGVTRSVTLPLYEGFLGGVSTGIKTSGKKSILEGGIFQDDVALHFTIGQTSKESSAISTVSSAIGTLRNILIENKSKDGVFGSAANGTLPLVVRVQNKYDILQLLKLKKELPDLNLVLLGGSGAASVADEIAAAKVPVILAPVRASPDEWEKGAEDTLTGPPSTRSAADVLSEAGVFYAIAIGSVLGDARIHDTMIEASWAAKYAGLDRKEAVDLVTRNVEKILGLKVDEAKRDIVIYEGDPLEFGASVVLTVDGDDSEIVTCWPEVQ